MQWKPQNGVKFYVVDKRKNGPGHVATFRWAKPVRLMCPCCQACDNAASKARVLYTPQYRGRTGAQVVGFVAFTY